MDRKLPEKAEIAQLIRQSASARSCLSGEAARIKQRFDIPARIRGSLSAHPTTWLFGSLASGFAASLLFSRRRKISPKAKGRGLTGTLLGLALTAARPMAKVWFSNQVGRWLLHDQANTSADHPLARPLPKSQFP